MAALLAGGLENWIGVRPTLTVGTALLIVPLVVLYRSPLRTLRKMPVASPNYLHQGGNSLNVSTSSSSQPKSTAVLLANSRGEYLLHLRDAYKTICDPGTRYQVDGGPEPGETLDEAIAREILEETGLILPDVTPYTSAQAHGPNVTEGNIQVYTARWDGAAHDLPVSDGITFAWFDVATMEQLPMCPWAHEVIKAHHAEHPAPQVPGPRDGTGQGGAGAVKNERAQRRERRQREAGREGACLLHGRRRKLG
ncbi:NUDIX domain-containing protein [Streptomyces atratus]|uniref:NUDIX domain-containing protein n=1 Tax=Streptomyces atratus TaxID=1893 RepID=UPI0036902996